MKTAVRHTGKRITPMRVLVVNVFFDEYRRMNGSPYRVPRAMGHIYLAGAFSRSRCDVRIYCEQYSGVLEDLKLLAWPDMLVLTGLTASFDRMLHLTAYARSLNPHVVVVAGGSAVRALPNLCRQYFDYACVGPIEDLRQVVRDALGSDYVANDMFPRLDLAPRGRILAYVESSRACNFRCNFCSLTAENDGYLAYDLDYIRRQILAVGCKQLVFIDNNFYGNDRSFFLQRVEMLRELYRDRRIRGWSALVTGDFFSRPENLSLVAEAGCKSLFSGIESFDADTLLSFNKKQNTLLPQVELIRNCLEAGIVFTYGIVLDPTSRRLKELRREIEFVTATPEITLPAFLTLAIPLLGTPYFHDCMAQRKFFPNTCLRHLDGVTLAMQTLDPTEDALAFIRDLPSLRGYRGRVLRHIWGFANRYRGRLDPLQFYVTVVTALLICTTSAASGPFQSPFRRRRSTYYGPTEELDPQYTPLMRVSEKFRAHFRPTMVTDAAGDLASDLIDDFGGAPPPNSISPKTAERQ
jgi:hypothetical protein